MVIDDLMPNLYHGSWMIHNIYKCLIQELIVINLVDAIQ